MVCVSRITKTQILHLDRLLAALKAAGVEVYSSNKIQVATAIGTFSRNNEKAAFGFSGTIEEMGVVGRAYAELSARTWASRRQWSITESKAGQSINLIQRRD